MCEEEKITIKFEATDLGGAGHYSAESTFPIFDCGEGPLVSMGRKFNDFLRQMTYVRENDYLFMEDVNEDEYEALFDFLMDYREKHGGRKCDCADEILAGVERRMESE